METGYQWKLPASIVNGPLLNGQNKTIVAQIQFCYYDLPR